MTITTTIPTDVPATLVLRPEYGDDRPVTEADLDKLGYRNTTETALIAERALIAALTGDPDTDVTRRGWELANSLRHLLHVAITHDLTHSSRPPSVAAVDIAFPDPELLDQLEAMFAPTPDSATQS